MLEVLETLKNYQYWEVLKRLRFIEKDRWGMPEYYTG